WNKPETRNQKPKTRNSELGTLHRYDISTNKTLNRRDRSAPLVGSADGTQVLRGRSQSLPSLQQHLRPCAFRVRVHQPAQLPSARAGRNQASADLQSQRRDQVRIA